MDGLSIYLIGDNSRNDNYALLEEHIGVFTLQLIGSYSEKTSFENFFLHITLEFCELRTEYSKIQLYLQFNTAKLILHYVIWTIIAPVKKYYYLGF
jgi:hypothetical protein